MSVSSSPPASARIIIFERLRSSGWAAGGRTAAVAMIVAINPSPLAVQLRLCAVCSMDYMHPGTPPSPMTVTTNNLLPQLHKTALVRGAQGSRLEGARAPNPAAGLPIDLADRWAFDNRYTVRRA